MAVKIRLRSQGNTNRIVYRIVVADSRSPRDGKYIESIGWYNPYAKELDKKFSLVPDRLQYWLSCGAECTDKVESIMKKATPTLLVEHKAKVSAKRAKDAKARRNKK